MNGTTKTTSPVIISVVATIVRAALLWLLGVIAAKSPAIYHFITDIVGQLGGTEAVVISLSGALVVLLLAIYARLKSRFKLNVALQLPKFASPSVIDKTVAASSMKEIISTQPDPATVQTATNKTIP